MSDKIKVQLQVSHYTGGERGEGVELRVVDESSRIHFLSIDMTHEQLGHLLGSRCMSDLPAEVVGLHLVGKAKERKSHNIAKFADVYEHDKIAKLLAKECKQYEVDGWKADIDGALRTRQPRDHYAVSFYRYIGANGEPICASQN
jgi:hypothetical protein